MAQNKIPLRKRKKKQQQLKTLPTLARPLIKNPEKFKFEDPIEKDEVLALIRVAPKGKMKDQKM